MSIALTNGVANIKFFDRLTPRTILLGLFALATPCFCVGAIVAFILIRSSAVALPTPTARLIPSLTSTVTTLVDSASPSELPPASVTVTIELLPTPTQLFLGPTPIDLSNPTPIVLTTAIVYGTATPFGQMPLCADFNGSTSPLILANVPSGTAGSARVYCRVITDKYQIGVQSVLARGVLVAVDIFALNGGSSVTRFNNSVFVCLQGSGPFIFLDANQSPRAPQQLTSVNQNGYECANVPNAGTVVLVSQ